jgi:ABC-type Fe3+-hydroxamate transport system substrate-binding protein
VGGTKNPRIAAILDLHPDLVIVNVEENTERDAARLRAAGVRLWVTFPRTVADTLAMLRKTLALFDIEDPVGQVATLEARVAEQRQRTPEPRTRVFCPIWRDPWMTFNADTYPHDVLALCGGWNVFAERDRQYPLAADLGQSPPDPGRAAGRDTRYPRITLDEMAAHRPDVILLPDEPYAFGPDDAAALSAYADVPAIRHKRVHLIDGTLITWHGTRLLRALDVLPGLLS